MLGGRQNIKEELRVRGGAGEAHVTHLGDIKNPRNWAQRPRAQGQ